MWRVRAAKQQSQRLSYIQSLIVLPVDLLLLQTRFPALAWLGLALILGAATGKHLT